MTSDDTPVEGGVSDSPEQGRISAVAQILDDAVRRFPANLAVVVGDRRVRFKELREGAIHLATDLRDIGVKSGDHVAVWFPNSVEFVEAMYAVSYLDAVLVPVNTWFQARELKYVLQQSRSSVLIAKRGIQNDEFVHILDEVFPGESWDSEWTTLSLPEFPDLRALRVLNDANTESVSPSPRSPLSPNLGQGERPAYVMYTSGTTGSPKGAMLFDQAVARDADLFGARLGITESDKYYCPVPLFHAGGLVFVLLAAHSRGASVLSSTRFQAREALEELVDNKCTLIGGFDITYMRLVEALGDQEILSLRAGWWASGLPTVFEKVERRLGLKLMNLYGLTEASGNVTCTPLSWPLRQRANCQGIPLADRKVVIVDREQDEVQPNVIGEICVEGWGIMQGYYEKPVETAKAIDSRMRLHTGDSGYLDVEGALHYLGRQRDALKVGGENVSPVEVEEVILQHDGVAEVAVVGVADSEYGEIPIAVVRRSQGHFTSAEELLDFAKSRLAHFKLPRNFIFVEDFPRTSTGKIQKSVLIESISH